jgi:hypothetical protein
LCRDADDDPVSVWAALQRPLAVTIVGAFTPSHPSDDDAARQMFTPVKSRNAQEQLETRERESERIFIILTHWKTIDSETRSSLSRLNTTSCVALWSRKDTRH